MSFVPGKPCLVHAHLQIQELLRPNYQAVFQTWMDAESTRSGQCKVSSCIEHN